MYYSSVPHSGVITSSSIQDAMDIICQQGSHDHMSPNISKCILLYLSLKWTRLPPLHIAFDREQVATAATLTLLGVTFSHTLNRDAHIQKLISKANSKRHFPVVVCRSGLSVNHLIRFYVLFICRGVEYAVPIWHCGLSKTCRQPWKSPELLSTLAVPGPKLQGGTEHLGGGCKPFAIGGWSSAESSLCPCLRMSTSTIWLPWTRQSL